jgi:hypothetical protein
MPLGKRTDFGDAKYAGLDVSFTSHVEDELDVRSMLCTKCRFSIKKSQLITAAVTVSFFHKFSL